MFILDAARFREALRERGYRSIGELARALGVHRNTIHYYLSGRPVFPSGFEKIVTALGLKPPQVLIEKRRIESPAFQEIASLVDQLHSEFPEVSFILFGSRAEGRAKRYSDWDLGVYSCGGIDHSFYRRVAMRKDDLVEDFPFLVDLANLNRADRSFLARLSRNWVFLAGRQKDWMALQKEVLQ